MDDGTAKELLGEQFKRRLLMDGQYANVSFICTQTDDCESSEIMRDHQDVAQSTEGRWEKMQGHAERISAAQSKLQELSLAEEDLVDQVHDARSDWKEKKLRLRRVKKRRSKLEVKITMVQALWRGRRARADATADATADANANATATGSNGEQQSSTSSASTQVYATNEQHTTRVEELRSSLAAMRKNVDEAEEKLTEFVASQAEDRRSLTREINKQQRRLKPLCALTRNAYSTKQLQKDFRAGLDELTRGPDAEEQDEEMDSGEHESQNNDEEANVLAIPADFQMKVHCISANDFLKITGIKAASDGQSACFTKASDTGIPSLRDFVHQTTARLRTTATESLVHNSSDFLDRIKLCCSDTSTLSASSSFDCKKVFENSMNTFQNNSKVRIDKLSKSIEARVGTTLKPALEQGATKGTQAATTTVASWGSKSRRTTQLRDSEHNGLYWSTYFATCRRNGVCKLWRKVLGGLV